MSPNDKPETRCAKCGSLMFDKHRNCLMCGEKNAPTTKCACGHDWPDWAHTPTGCKPMRYNPATGEHDLTPAPPLPPTVVAVLEAVENLDQADDFRSLNPDLLEIEQERLLAAWHAYVAAGRPGMEEK